MKEHLISFAFGFITISIIAIIIGFITWLFGQDVVVIGLLLIVTWGMGNSIRESIRDRKENNE